MSHPRILGIRRLLSTSPVFNNGQKPLPDQSTDGTAYLTDKQPHLTATNSLTSLPGPVLVFFAVPKYHARETRL